MALRILLTILGWAFAAASRWRASFRRQLTRDVVVEIRSDDGVARHFVFRDRVASSAPGRAERADCAIRFATAAQAFAAFTASDGPQRLFAGLLEGTVTIEGRVALMPWFQGLVPAAVPGLPTLRLPATPPSPYVRPGSSPPVTGRITRQPAELALDPAWKAAVAAREKLVMMRVAAGWPTKKF